MPALRWKSSERGSELDLERSLEKRKHHTLKNGIRKAKIAADMDPLKAKVVRKKRELDARSEGNEADRLGGTRA
jgi:hypothetical protein